MEDWILSGKMVYEEKQQLLNFLEEWRKRIIKVTPRSVLYANPSSEAFGQLIVLNTVLDYVEHM